MNCLHSQWYARMKRALDPSGKSPATQESYLRSVRQLAGDAAAVLRRHQVLLPHRFGPEVEAVLHSSR